MRSRALIVALFLALGTAAVPAAAQISFGYSSPGLSIGINVPVYPNLVPVPGYPVYYAPNLGANYFFYDGLYWVLADDGNWYASDWYNGPWRAVDPDAVPLYVLRVPVRYYRHPLPFFRGWRADAPPPWDRHWGRPWVERHADWDRWDRRRAPAIAPLPTYQRRYSGSNYPHADQQWQLHDRNYRYQPREEWSRREFRDNRGQAQRAPDPRYEQRQGQRPDYRRDEGRRPEQVQRPQPQQQQPRYDVQRDRNPQPGPNASQAEREAWSARERAQSERDSRERERKFGSGG